MKTNDKLMVSQTYIAFFKISDIVVERKLKLKVAYNTVFSENQEKSEMTVMLNVVSCKLSSWL